MSGASATRTDRVVLLGDAAPTTMTLCQQHPLLAHMALEAHDTPDGWLRARSQGLDRSSPTAHPGTTGNPRHLLLVGDAPGPEALEREDRFRALLTEHRLAFSAVYPDASGWANGVAQACGLLPRPERQTLRRWACDACSDPDCEHRLFRDLLSRQAPPSY